MKGDNVLTLLLLSLCTIVVFQIYLCAQSNRQLQKNPKAIWQNIREDHPLLDDDELIATKKVIIGKKMISSVMHSSLSYGSIFRSYFCLLWSRDPSSIWIICPTSFRRGATMTEKNVRWSTRSLMYDIYSRSVDALVFDRMLFKVEPIPADPEDDKWKETFTDNEKIWPFKNTTNVNLRYFLPSSSFIHDKKKDKELDTDFVILCCRILQLKNVHSLPTELRMLDRIPPIPESNPDASDAPPVFAQVVAYSSSVAMS